MSSGFLLLRTAVAPIAAAHVMGRPGMIAARVVVSFLILTVGRRAKMAEAPA